VDPVSTIGRYSRTEGRKVDVPCPDLVKKYNMGMGGVDLLDSSVANYRVTWRKKKWWWALFAWSLSVQAVNAWRLRQRFTKTKEPYLKFLRELVVCLLDENGTKPVQARRSIEVPAALRENLR
jgi:hypothetical protein